ncbi:MAG: hypothetical protein ACI9TH_001503 [Kiritimatiellia bacterium]|jgi:hypothetical protein
MQDPIIVIGAARSGTKFIRDILGASHDLAVVPYDVNFIWRLGNEQVPHDRLTPEQVSDALAQTLQHRLARAARLKRTDKRRMIEKTVSNTIRVPFVNRVFPRARYIQLIRDGRDVTESSARQWQAATDWPYLLGKLTYFPLTNMRYASRFALDRLRGSKNKKHVAIWGPKYPGIEDDLSREGVVSVCARQWTCCVEQAQADLAAIPEERVMTVRYEDLVASEEPFAALCHFAGLSDTAHVMEAYRARVLRDTSGKWQSRMDEMARQQMLEIITPTLDKLGYL